MSISLITDKSYELNKLALDGLSLKEKAISNNVANVDTPGYTAKTVDFQSTLEKALGTSSELAMETTDSRHLTSPAGSTRFAETNRTGGTARADGNDVDIDVELTDMSQTAIEYQALTESVSKKLSLLSTIAQSR